MKKSRQKHQHPTIAAIAQRIAREALRPGPPFFVRDLQLVLEEIAGLRAKGSYEKTRKT